MREPYCYKQIVTAIYFQSRSDRSLKVSMPPYAYSIDSFYETKTRCISCIHTSFYFKFVSQNTVVLSTITICDFRLLLTGIQPLPNSTKTLSNQI